MRRLLFGAVLMVAACGGGDDASSTAGASASSGGSSGGAGSYSAQEVASAFRESSNLDPAICDCIGARAVAELNDEQIAFLIVSISGDGDAAEAMRSDIGVVNATQVAGFLTGAPLICASEVGPE